MSVSVSASVSVSVSYLRRHSASVYLCPCVWIAPMRAQALIASNWIAIDRELAYFSFVFASTDTATAGDDPSRRYGRIRVRAKRKLPEPKPESEEEATTLFDEDLRSCFDLCQQRPPQHRIPTHARPLARCSPGSIIRSWRQWFGTTTPRAAASASAAARGQLIYNDWESIPESIAMWGASASRRWIIQLKIINVL